MVAEGHWWAMAPRGWEKQRHLGGIVGLGGGGSQNELPGVEIPGKSTY